MSDAAYWLHRAGPAARAARRGTVRKAGRRGVRDDDGRFHALGCTFMWAVQGSTNPDERPKLLKTLDYIAEHLRADYVRVLAQVDWAGRAIDPTSPAFRSNLGWFMNRAFERGMRTLVTGIGGQGADALLPTVINSVSDVVRDGRAYMFFGGEVANEWHVGEPDKVMFPNLEKYAGEWQRLLPDHLIMLSCQKPESKNTPEGEHPERDAMMAATARAGASMYTEHPRRTKMEFGWDNVSQAYDMRLAEPFVAVMGEPVGPQSSVASEMRPLFLAAMRAACHVCSGAVYCFHPGQMVTGQADPNHGRPEYLWDVPGMAEMMRAVHAIGAYLPEEVEDWRVRNNARDDHPLPLPERAFWSDRRYEDDGWVNKNYAAVGPEGRFAEVLAGVKTPIDDQLVVAGHARAACRVRAVNLASAKVVDQRTLQAGEPWLLRGRVNSEAGYLLLGEPV